MHAPPVSIITKSTRFVRNLLDWNWDRGEYFLFFQAVTLQGLIECRRGVPHQSAPSPPLVQGEGNRQFARQYRGDRGDRVRRVGLLFVTLVTAPRRALACIFPQKMNGRDHAPGGAQAAAGAPPSFRTTFPA